MASTRAQRREAMRDLRRSVERGMQAAGLGPGPWTGAAARLAIGAAAEVTERVLTEQVANLDQADALSWAAGALAMSHHAQSASRDKLTPSLERAMELNFHSENAMAARVVLEIAARNAHGGHRRVDELAAINLAKLGHQVWRWKLLTDRVSCGLVDVDAVTLASDATFSVGVVDLPPFSMRSFENTYMNRMARTSGREVDADAHLMEALVRAATDDDVFPDELFGIDQGLRQSRGYGLIAAVAALSFLARWAGGPDEGIAGRNSPTLESLQSNAAGNVRTWYPHVDIDELRVAVRWMVWTQDLIQETPLSLHLHRDVPARLYSRPAVELRNRSVFVPSGAPDVALVVLALVGRRVGWGRGGGMRHPR